MPLYKYPPTPSSPPNSSSDRNKKNLPRCYFEGYFVQRLLAESFLSCVWKPVDDVKIYQNIFLSVLNWNKFLQKINFIIGKRSLFYCACLLCTIRERAYALSATLANWSVFPRKCLNIQLRKILFYPF